MLEQINKIKILLGLTDETEDKVIETIYDDVLASALSFCNLTLETIPQKTEMVFYSIVRNNTIAYYNRRGNEGMSSANVGGQGSSYLNLDDEMKKQLLNARCRIWK